MSGCSPVSLGCLNCWSEGKWTGEIRLMEQDLNKPLKVKKPTTWAVWNDLFHESVPFRFVDKAIAVMALCPQHTFLILTKRPARMLEYFCNYPSVCSDGNVEHELTTNPDLLWEASRLFGGTPERYCDIVGVDETQASSDYMVELDHLPTFPLPNIWLGISAEYHAHYLPRTHYLKQTPARVRFVSIESCLGPFYYIDLDDIDWCIVGAETGPHKRPMELDWARLLRDQCIASGTPFFFKRDSDGNHELDGQLWEEFPV
ncbi:MAG: DUF5131 family protein [Planctomycetes bacterium]|nr:DUF5131 family protein [Planctomycetota bacterium]